jgi:hypothetical protein
MKESKNQIYEILIIFFIFMVYKKTLDFAIEIKLPTYENLDKVSVFWKNLVYIRDINAFAVLLLIMYLVVTVKFNFFMNFILLILFLNNVIYFLIDRRLINKILNKKDLNNELIQLIDIYADKFDNLVIALFCIYVMIKIFYG